MADLGYTLPYLARVHVRLTANTQDGAPHTISLLVNDLLDTAAFPVPPGQAANAEGDAQARALGFRSLDACVSLSLIGPTDSTADRSVRTFVAQYDRDIIARLIPGLQKEGYRAP
jgi:hypothetical protein